VTWLEKWEALNLYSAFIEHLLESGNEKNASVIIGVCFQFVGPSAFDGFGIAANFAGTRNC
jgi:hypothetical protein